MRPRLGVIADDLTGACDVAAGVTAAGLPAEVRLGVPDVAEQPAAPCVVVALKSRTAPVAEAVAESRAAAVVLREWGADRLYQKYCSTFDSTDDGNIGPVADSLVDLIGGAAVTIGTPVTPAVGRTMHRGHLFVGDRLLSESSLARHPLTPMRDPDLVRVLARQTEGGVGLVGIEDVRAGGQTVRSAIARLRGVGVRHILVDGVEDHDLDLLAAALENEVDVVVGGAAGLAAALARRMDARAGSHVGEPPEGRRLLLSGSGSEATRAQMAAFGGAVFTIDADAAVSEPDAVVAAALDFADAEPLPLVSATAAPDEIVSAQERWGVQRAAAALEDVLARVAVGAVDRLGVRRILVAGGETSGAVARALGIRALRVRRVIAPGVPWMSAVDDRGRTLELCFKSGNFGDVDLFDRAWDERPAG